MLTDEQLAADHELWIEELRSAVRQLSDDNADHTDAVRTFFDSVFKLNDGLGFIIPLAALPNAVRLNELFTDTVARMRDVVPEMISLRDALPRSILVSDAAVSHAGFHTRSWASIVCAAANYLVSILGSRFSAKFSMHVIVGELSRRNYDSELIAVQLQIECQRIEALRLADSVSADSIQRELAARQTDASAAFGIRINYENRTMKRDGAKYTHNVAQFSEVRTSDPWTFATKILEAGGKAVRFRLVFPAQNSASLRQMKAGVQEQLKNLGIKIESCGSSTWKAVDDEGRDT